MIQNGVEHDARLAPHAVVPAIINTAVERLAPGRLKHGSGDTLTLADRPGARAFAELLAGTPLNTKLEGDFTTAAWRKLFANLAGNPLTTHHPASQRGLPGPRGVRARPEGARGSAARRVAPRAPSSATTTRSAPWTSSARSRRTSAPRCSTTA